MKKSRLNFLNEQGPVTKHCSKCGRRIPVNSPYDLCKECMKRELFPKVKDYINDNYDVNEMMVAEEFGIDRSIVHEWVREGHLEYRQRPKF
ncbi:hypothetical protein [Pseudobutyrivibrio xylanivorans]|uniref:Uncharacterized protein n=1 Tax=Pseudobutyrivibrio xylanivorans TaxID=185007 RepID=A0A5P6VR54_PSEXY|nr:hypothetical protein [Pseudobutyrivibrio xylanivorans]QFJ54838.1 hypothetical protein FXF36_08215 [Pseudobutyrivibrio xylanivorans]